MLSGREYRVGSAVGTAVLTGSVVMLANARPVQAAITTHVPLVRNLQPTVLDGGELLLAMFVTLVVIGAAVAPLYKPHPRRILSIVFRAQKRIVLAGMGLATLGYLGFPYELPRGVLLTVVATLCVAVPPWFVAIRQVPNGTRDRTVVVGDDPREIRRVYDALSAEPVGYVGPRTTLTDGGELVRAGETTETAERPSPIGDLGHLGGFPARGDVIRNENVDTVGFAFAETDRERFFDALGECHDHGIDAVIHREKADSVLVSEAPGRELLSIDVEPWDWQDRVVKRAFDVAFASFGLVCLSPVVLAIAAAIKAEDGGSILYGQNRTAELGETFTAYKFRSMSCGGEDCKPGEKTDRVTWVGGILRKTHTDEIPQLWSILTGDMSVVGPRAAWTEEEHVLEMKVESWSQRWFVKPGLTGLAQINDASSEEPERKLHYDIEYIKSQSLRFDMAIVIRQIWQVATDVLIAIRHREIEEN